MKFLTDRLKEASTWAGLGVPLTGLATQLPAPYSYYAYAAAAVCGMAAAAVKG